MTTWTWSDGTRRTRPGVAGDGAQVGALAGEEAHLAEELQRAVEGQGLGVLAAVVLDDLDLAVEQDDRS